MERLKRHKFLTAIWLVVFVIGGYFSYLLFFKSSGGENPYTITAREKAAQDTRAAETLSNQIKVARVDEAATDGSLEITVKGTKCNAERTVGENQYARAEAEGQFCRITVAIKNVSAQPASLPLAAQKITVAGDVYPPDEDATQYAQADQTKDYWYDKIAPGATVSGDLLVDVNGDQQPSLIELHAAEDSPGIKVEL